MTEEQKRLFEEIQKKGVVQEQANKEVGIQNLSSEIGMRYDRQTAATSFIEQAQAQSVGVESLLSNLNAYYLQNITPYTRKNDIEPSENYKTLYMFCAQLPQYIQAVIANGGEISIANIGIPDPSILHIIKDWTNRYIQQNYSENLQADFVIPEYQMIGEHYKTIYKPTDVLKLSIQKNEKVK